MVPKENVSDNGDLQTPDQAPVSPRRQGVATFPKREIRDTVMSLDKLKGITRWSNKPHPRSDEPRYSEQELYTREDRAYRKGVDDAASVITGSIQEDQQPSAQQSPQEPPSVESSQQPAPPKGTIFAEGRPRRKREYTPEDYDQLLKVLASSLENEDAESRQAAEDALRGFAKRVAPEVRPEMPQEIREQGITITSAAREFNVPANLLWRWTKEWDIISPLWEGYSKGSPTYLPREQVAEIVAIYHEAKQAGVFPKKLLERKYGKPRRKARTQEPQEPKLMTLKEAEATHGIAYDTLRSWYRSGHLPEKGRSTFPTHGGGKILVDERDIRRLMRNPPPRGRPPRKPTQ